MFDQKKIHAEVEALTPRIIADRRWLHEHAEASLNEHQTAAYIAARLDELGIPHIAVGETGVLGSLEGAGPGPTVMLRADIDALPLHDGCEADWANTRSEANHACGHDGHTAALLGAAEILAAHRDDFNGTIKFAFQQAEEIGEGGFIFEKEGALEGLDQVFGFHFGSDLPAGVVGATAGPQWASVDQFRIDVHGKGGHVSRPDLANDALIAGASIVLAAQQIVARELSPFDQVVVGIGKFEAGENYNIIAESAVIEGTVRAFDEDVRAKVIASLERIAIDTAHAHGTTAEFTRKVNTDVLDNDPQAAAFAARIAGEIDGVTQVETNSPQSAGGDDFAVFLHHAPGVYCRVGSGGTPETSHGHHTYKFALNEAALPIGTELHVSYALRWFQTEQP